MLAAIACQVEIKLLWYLQIAFYQMLVLIPVFGVVSYSPCIENTWVPGWGFQSFNLRNWESISSSPHQPGGDPAFICHASRVYLLYFII